MLQVREKTLKELTVEEGKTSFTAEIGAVISGVESEKPEDEREQEEKVGKISEYIHDRAYRLFL